ncbi:MAG: hypothetical protein ACUVT7_03830 [Thermoplasmata archaeon]
MTALDSLGWAALKEALNQRVVIGSVKFVPSKKNRVWIVETDVRPVVIKRFFSGRCGHEFEALLQAKGAGLNVPYPLHVTRDYLVTEYLEGESCDILVNHMFSAEAADGIGKWLALFHQKLGDGVTKKLMADAVLSNFILHEGSVYGLDLEDSRPGDPLDDVGQAAASILGSEPFFTPIKFDLCKRMIMSYSEVADSDIMQAVRPFVSKHIRIDANKKPLFRRTFIAAATSLEKQWPDLV